MEAKLPMGYHEEGKSLIAMSDFTTFTECKPDDLIDRSLTLESSKHK